MDIILSFKIYTYSIAVIDHFCLPLIVNYQILFSLKHLIFKKSLKKVLSHYLRRYIRSLDIIRCFIIKYSLKHVCAICIIIMDEGLTTHTILCHRRHSARTNLACKRRCLSSKYTACLHYKSNKLVYRIEDSFFHTLFVSPTPSKACALYSKV